MKNTMTTPARFADRFTRLSMACAFVLAFAAAAAATENWKGAFEDVCSKVDASQTMSIKELESLIQQADKLLPEIQKSEDPAKKIYLKRLKNCRSIFEFSIESKKNSGK